MCACGVLYEMNHDVRFLGYSEHNSCSNGKGGQFDHKSLNQLRDCFVADEDLRG